MTEYTARTTTADGACSWKAMAQFMGCYAQKNGKLPFDVQSPNGQLLLQMINKVNPKLGLSTDPALAGQQLLQALNHCQSRRQMEGLLAQPLAAMHHFQIAQSQDPSVTLADFDVSTKGLGFYQYQDMQVFTHMVRELGWNLSYQDTTSSVNSALTQLNLEGHTPAATAPHFRVQFTNFGGGHYKWMAADEEVAREYSATRQPSPVPSGQKVRDIRLDRSSAAYTAAEQQAKRGQVAEANQAYDFGPLGTKHVDAAQQKAFDTLLANLVQQAWSDPATSHLSFEQIKENAMGQLFNAASAQAKAGQVSAYAIQHSSAAMPLFANAHATAQQEERQHQIETGCAA